MRDAAKTAAGMRTLSAPLEGVATAAPGVVTSASTLWLVLLEPDEVETLPLMVSEAESSSVTRTVSTL